MLSIRLTLKKILQRLKKMSDFPIENGKDGVWYYVKWNSGRLELWCQDSFASGTWSGGGALYYGASRTIKLPTMVVDVENVTFSPKSANGAVVIPGTQKYIDSSNSVYVYYVRSYGGNNNVTITQSVKVDAYWKTPNLGGVVRNLLHQRWWCYG